MNSLRLSRGKCLPLGATGFPEGINFSLLCRHGTEVHLAVYSLDGATALAEIVLHPRKNRTGDHWHILLAGLPEEFCYGWRVNGPNATGNAFEPDRVLIDPAAIAISGGATWANNKDLEPPPERLGMFSKNILTGFEDVHLCTPMEDTIIYELHVRGFTWHPTSLTTQRGTFLGLTEKIPYLKTLGVTAVELLPIHEFDEKDCPFFDPVTGERLRNFWGYNTLAFSAVKAAYASSGPANQQIVEFRDMVRSFHQAGIEVILDVVFNHTGEGDYRGKTHSFRGLDNSTYYMLDAKGSYLNFSGCGNTLNCNHPIVRELIINCLRFWVAEMQVDGLRFDLASILGRDYTGQVLIEPPIVEMIAEDGVLADTKLIAEPWDAAGLYQVGMFPFGRRWSEWNGMYRDHVRQFWTGMPGMATQLATRVCGSSDLYEPLGRKPRHSLNFITCHDGFTLWDLVSYNEKQNYRNGEDNRDGCNHNYSWNCGAEGPTDDPFILALRKRQVRNLATTLFLSQGIPMILAGDEFLRTQMGNNNAWCQDNEASWVDWTLLQKNADFHRFMVLLIKLRKNHSALRRRSFLKDGDIVWHGLEPLEPDFSETATFLAFALNGYRTSRELDRDFFVVFNASQEAKEIRIPVSPTGRIWRRVIDTSLAPPLEIVSTDEGPVVPFLGTYPVGGFSTLVLISEKKS
ncbi:MAG: glycogen debranching enzyme GlgX [Gemmataceae bacterium]|nr:glycogen debranching enzyme GlgX [Gemmataceae bacterium]